MEYSVKIPNDVAEMVGSILRDTEKGKHRITVMLVIEDGEIKSLKVE